MCIDIEDCRTEKESMGSLCRETPSLAQDLKITIHDTCLVFPAQETEQKSMFLSNIDKVLNFQVQTVHFFPSNKDLPPYVVAEKLKSTLKKLLVPYHFLAGRFKLNPKTGRLEIDCNSAGAGFVVASSEYELEEIGDLVYPNPGFARLAPTTMESLGDDDQPLFTMQVTSFRCGGFAMGIATNHATFDGLSFKLFLDNLAALAADKPLAITPCNDRQLLAARSPPRVTFSHPELVQLEALKPTVFDDTHEDLDFKIFRLTPEVITNLQEKATGGPLHSNLRVSRFNAITALLWRCKALSSCETDTTLGTLHGFERESTILYAVDIRPRLTPPLPPSYTGNAVLTAYATTTCKEILEGPFSRLVDMISEGARRMTDEFARSVIDWGELYTGIPNGEVLVSSWWRLGFAEVEYPWGRPKYSSPVVNHRKDIILLFPDIDDKDGVNVLVSLPRKEMIKFQGLFEKFLT